MCYNLASKYNTLFKKEKKMKKYWKEILFILVVVIAIGYIFLDSKRDIAYHFKSVYYNDPESLTVDVFMTRNGKGDLITYSTNIYYMEAEIKGTLLYYLKNDKKEIISGGSVLNNYFVDKRNSGEYNDYLNLILDNADNLYFDLCRDSECKDILTLKLEKTKLF